jgi:hypothetical protein
MGWAAGVLFSAGGGIFLFIVTARPALESTEPLNKSITYALSSGANRPERESPMLSMCGAIPLRGMMLN